MFPYLFRKESFVSCLTGLQICKGWNLSKGSNWRKGELLNAKAEAKRCDKIERETQKALCQPHMASHRGDAKQEGSRLGQKL